MFVNVFSNFGTAIFLFHSQSQWLIMGFSMPSNTSKRIQMFRLAGYFAVFIGFLTAINWIVVIRENYVREHEWPAASATVYSMREDSRVVTPPTSRQNSYPVYWVEFFVILDLPQSQCPGNTVPLTTAEPQCTGKVRTPEVRSRMDAVDWFKRHPSNSKVTVHYDAQSGQMALGGESIFYIYPWERISVTLIIFAVAAFMLLAGRTELPSKYSPGIPEIKEE